MTPDHRAQLAHSPWAGRWPGLREEAVRWLGELGPLLAESSRRSDEIIAAAPGGGRTVVRLARLAAAAGPSLASAVRSGDTDDLVGALADTALRGGPTYVKLGQLIASTRGLVPDWIAEAFEGCRDAVPPASPSAVASVLRNAGIEDGLRAWERHPVASASVAQVHRAILADGTDVVVKVRRPGIVGTVASDVAYLAPVLRFAERARERARMANLSGMLDLMVRLFAQEVDLRLEAANIADMALSLERAELDVKVPAPVPGMVTKRAMVMEFVDGTSWSEEGVVSGHGHAGAELVRVLMTGIVRTTLSDGIFHGDLHPGNVFVDRDGLALLDFGITGRLSEDQRAALAKMLLALVARDQLGLVRALQDFGSIPPDVDVEDLVEHLPPPPTEDEIRAMREDRSAVPRRFAGVQRVLAERGFRVVPEMALFARNFVYLGEAIERHAPDFDLPTELTAIAAGLRRRGGAA